MAFPCKPPETKRTATMKNSRTSVGLVALAAILLAIPAPAATIYTISAPEAHDNVLYPGQFGTVDTVTGAYTMITQVFPPDGMEGTTSLVSNGAGGFHTTMWHMGLGYLYSVTTTGAFSYIGESVISYGMSRSGSGTL